MWPARPSRRVSRSGTVWYAIAVPGHETEAVSARLPFDRERIRQFSTITVLNLLRLRLSSVSPEMRPPMQGELNP